MPAAPSSPMSALLLTDGLHGFGWTVALALLSALLATLEHGWQILPRTRLADAGEGPASRERLQRLLAESDRAEIALLVLRTASQVGLVTVLVLLSQEWLPRWWPECGEVAPVVIAGGVAFAWITLFCRVLPGEVSSRALETLVRATLPMVVFLGRLLAPPIETFRRLLRAAGNTTPQAQAEAYEEEILATVEEGEREGHLVEHQAD